MGLGSATAVDSSTSSSTGCAWGAEPAVACSAFTREAFGRLAVPCRAQEKLQAIAFRIDCSVQVRPRSFDLDGGFIHAPGVIRGFEVRSRALFKFWRVALHPPVDGGMVHLQFPFPHQFLQVAIAQRVAKVPADTQENDLSFARDAL